MILLNTTFCVDDNIAGAFIDFIREVYMPLADSSDLHSALLTEVRVTPETNTLTGQLSRSFALQMRAPSQEVADDFRCDILPELYRLIGQQWGPAVGMFESVLDVVYDHSKK